jgi:GTPase
MSQILGSTFGLKKKEIRELERLSRRTVAPEHFVSPALAEELCLLALEIKRPITILVDRLGRVSHVYTGSVAALGEENRLSLHAKRNGLCAYRAITTQLESIATPDKGALTTLLQYHLDCLVTLAATAHPEWSLQHGEHPKACDAVFISGLIVQRDGRIDVKTEGPATLHQVDRQSFRDYQEIVESDLAANVPPQIETAKQETAFLIGLAQPGVKGKCKAEDLLDELAMLAHTAGAKVVGRAIQTRSTPDSQLYIGKGKAQELAFEVQQQGANLIITDDELTTVQQRRLEYVLRTRVIDRTELILDIFAQRAQSWEGKIQVELAQLQYLLPRLTGKGASLSQQTAAARGGTIATRGPGETKLEMDRRRLRERITDLERQAESVRKTRQIQRKERIENGIPIVALVGYTNAGKSTLLNTLTRAGVFTENKLFATLDPVTRRLTLPDMSQCLVVDTVGFIQKLPTTLVKAFRSTLEEAQLATLIVHVADLSHPDRLTHLEAVESTLRELDCDTKPQWILLNKIDKVKQPEAEMQALQNALNGHPAFPVSATNGNGIREFLAALQGFLHEQPAVAAATVQES